MTIREFLQLRAGDFFTEASVLHQRRGCFMCADILAGLEGMKMTPQHGCHDGTFGFPPESQMAHILLELREEQIEDWLEFVEANG